MVDNPARTSPDDQQAYNRSLNEHIVQHALPTSYLDTVTDWLEPIAADISSVINRPKMPTKQSSAPDSRTTIVLGVQGTQGSGKSTCSDFLKLILKQRHNLNAAVLSIDDFYLTRDERKKLSEVVHPLLQTRGVPGTHDVTLAISTIKQLKSLKKGDSCSLPHFNKSIDDRSPENSWQTIEGPIDVVILEGWCVGLVAEDESSLDAAINGA